MAARKTAAQKAAEAAEREEYTHYDTAIREEAPEQDTKDLSTVKDEKTGKYLTIQQLKNKLRNEAEREVLDAHKGEVVSITAAKYDKHGLQYVRRLSEEEKAAKQIEDLYAQFPNLRPQVQQQQAQQEQVQAVPGGALETFRVTGGFTDGPDPDEAGDLSYPSEYGMPDGDQ